MRGLNSLPIVVLLCSTAWADIDFVRDVQPILRQRCYQCHGETAQRSGLRLDIKSEAFRGGDGWGPSIVPHASGDSPLVQLIKSQDPDERMPPEKGPLSKREIGVLETWIREGAEWPEGVDPAQLENKLEHWSFKPRPQEYSLDSIDAFVDRKLTEKGLSRNPPADPNTLLRRLHLDITGLPPTPRDVSNFLDAPNVPQVVDRLLASPRYGERWAQHWLDVIRWAETVGFETNAERRNAWHYRDWVIQSLNQDKPYDEFIFEQLAGDTIGQDAALGFLVAGPANLPGQIGRDEAAMRGARQDELDEVINTVSQSFMGLTVACARCHDHKFDPITQEDYYSMQALFSGLHYGSRRLRGEKNDAMAAQIPAASQQVAALKQSLEEMRQRFELREPVADVHTETFPPVRATAVRMQINATNNNSAASLYEFQVWDHDPASASNRDLGAKRQFAQASARNVALASQGAKINASSFALANQSRHFDNLVDGTVDRRQSYPWVAAKIGPAWLQVDFPLVQTISSVTFHRGNSSPADFRIEILSADDGKWHEVVQSRKRLPRIDDTRPAEQIELPTATLEEKQELAKLLGRLRKAQSRLASLKAGPQVYAASFTQPSGETFLLRRGDAMQQAYSVEPALPEFLADLGLNHNAPETSWRLALAKHLTAPDHPLTARVIVNRVWHYHFGTGLVDTPSDFGRMGTSPTHPELLDWLAEKLIEDGWSLKKLHRRILLSQTYQQSSAPNEEASSIDSDSRLLWRFPPRRVEAETLRDAILAVSGKINLQVGGRGFDFFNQRGGLADYRPKQTFSDSGFRRMIYAHKVRMISVDVFGAFDCPDAGQMKPSRTRSITPVQSLGLFNSPFVLRQAAFFADRVRVEAGDEAAEQVERTFEIAFSRQPTQLEKERLVPFVEQHGLASLCRAILNTSEFAFIQ